MGGVAMKSFFGIVAFLLSFGVTIPYAIDIVKGRAKPARSTRILFLMLMAVTLVVQGREFTSWVLLLTVAEVLTQMLLFSLSIKYGIGGLARFDVICYAAFVVSLSAYLVTQDAVLSLTLLMLTDFISFLPTLVKIWRDPTSDTWPFFLFGGVVAAAAALLARNTNAYVEVAFPAYLLAANALAAAPILLHNKRKKLKQAEPIAPL
jgi:hypothetical protein